MNKFGSNKTIFSILLIVFLSVICMSQEIKTTKKNGVEIIKNPISPPVSLQKAAGFKLREDLIIGKNQDQADYVFGLLTSIRVDDSGNIYALDGKDLCIKVFDGNGHFLYSFARKGQGPGELEQPVDFFILQNATVAVLEFRNNRISYFKKSGEFIRSVSLGKYRLWQFITNSNSQIYGENLNFPSMELLIFDSDMNKIGQVASFKIDNIENPPPLQLYQRFRFTLNSEDQLIWTMNDDYTLNVSDATNQIIKIITRDYIPVKVTTAYVRNELQKMNPRRKLPEKIKIPGHWPNHLPIIDSVIGDDENNLFIRTNERDEKGRVYYDIFDKDGKYFQKFAHPENEIIKVIKNNMIYCLIPSDENGIPLIKRYILDWE